MATLKTQREGFQGQKLIRIPRGIDEQFAADAMSRQLYLTDIGFYPPVYNHKVTRTDPIDQFVLIYCTDGEGWCELDGRRQTIPRNTFFVLPLGKPHSYGNVENAFWEIYWIHFKGEQAERMVSRLCEDKFAQAVRLTHRNELLQLFHQVIADLEVEISPEAYHFANARLWHILGDMVYYRRFGHDKDGGMIEKAISVMKAHVEETLALTDLAEELGLSSSYFCRLFKKRMDQSPIDFFIRLKMQRACQYLDFTDMTVQEVALALGYDDPFYFSRVFKRVMGLSPLNYRQKS